jgi:hypothetical protein
MEERKCFMSRYAPQKVSLTDGLFEDRKPGTVESRVGQQSSKGE